MNNKLTLLVTLKDRSSFTKRFCDYLSLIEYPFFVIFADGSLGDENEKIFKNLKNQNFLYEYIRFPPDQILTNYYEKLFVAVKRVKTPYIVLADNDDFPIIEGQLKALEFLEFNNDYVGCTGRTGGVIIHPSSNLPYGKKVLNLSYYCHYMDVSVALDQTNALERIKSYLNNFYSIFYSIYRTDSIKINFEAMQKLDFSDLGIFELFFSYLQLTQGKIKTLNSLIYVRQKGSSQAAASQKDWFHRLFYSAWLSDLKQALCYVSEMIAKREQRNCQDVYDTLYSDFVVRQRKRFLPLKFYFCANFNLFFNKEYVKYLIYYKVFKISPSIGEKWGYYSLTKITSKSNLNKIKAIITKEYP